MNNSRFMDLNKVRMLALNKGMSERDLLTAAGLNISLLAYKRHKGGKVAPETILKIANVLECSPLELFSDCEQTTIEREKYFLLDADKISNLALVRGMTEQQLLKRAGVNPNKISKARHAKQRTTAKIIYKIADVLECDPLDIVKDPQGGEDNAEG